MGKLDVNLHPGQLEVFNSTAQFKVLCAGRRFGKTTLTAWIVLLDALAHPQGVYWIISPVYPQTKILWRMIRKILLTLPQGYVTRIMEGELFIELTNGSTIWAKSGDNPTALRGEGLNGVIIDESAYVNRVVWEESIEPALVDKNGWAVFIGTPAGKNWFYELFLRGLDPSHEDWASFRYETKDNPYIPGKWLEKKRLTTPEMIWRQEYEAEFIEGGGVVFRGVDKVVLDCLLPPNPASVYCIGVDLGRHSDFTVITVGDINTNSVVYIERFNREDWAYIESRIREVYNTYNQGTIYIDSTGMGDPIYEDLAKSGMMIYGINMNVSTKPMLIENLQLLIERQAIHIPDDQELLLELSAYTYSISASGNVKYNAPCFTGDTLVLGEQIKPIDKVNYDDSVISCMGNLCKCNPTKRDYSGDMVGLTIWGELDHIKCTPEHPVFTLKRIPQDSQRKSMRKRPPAPEWVAAKDIKKGDRVFLPKRKNLPKTEIPEDLLYVMGWYLAEGHIHYDKWGSGTLAFTLNQKEGYEADFIVNTLLKYFPKPKIKEFRGYTTKKGNKVKAYTQKNNDNPPYRIKYRNREKMSSLDITYYSTKACKFFEEHCGKMSYGKELSKSLFNLSGTLPLVCGWLDGDGHIRKDQQHDISIVSASETLSRQMRQIMLDNNIYCTIKTFKTNNKLERHTCYIINIKNRYAHLLKDSIKAGLYKHNYQVIREMTRETEEGFWPIVRETNISHFEGEVYNLEVDGDQTYVAGGIGVHNCGFHDDCVISLALCAFGMSGGAATTIGSFQPSEETEAELFYDEIPNVIEDWDDYENITSGD
jgi:hypothetical protein